MEEFNADLRIDTRMHNRSNPSFLSSGYIGAGFGADVVGGGGMRSSNAGTFVPPPTPPKSIAESALA